MTNHYRFLWVWMGVMCLLLACASESSPGAAVDVVPPPGDAIDTGEVATPPDVVVAPETTSRNDPAAGRV